jgi:endonuclease III
VRYKRHAHHRLILHRRFVCLANCPLCEKCLIAVRVRPSRYSLLRSAFLAGDMIALQW